MNVILARGNPGGSRSRDKQTSSIRAFDSVGPAFERDISGVGFRRLAGVVEIFERNGDAASPLCDRTANSRPAAAGTPS